MNPTDRDILNTSKLMRSIRRWQSTMQRLKNEQKIFKISEVMLLPKEKMNNTLACHSTDYLYMHQLFYDRFSSHWRAVLHVSIYFHTHTWSSSWQCCFRPQISIGSHTFNFVANDTIFRFFQKLRRLTELDWLDTIYHTK
jgi:poly(3-hydroxybutyrate) depolymerase